MTSQFGFWGIVKSRPRSPSISIMGTTTFCTSPQECTTTPPKARDIMELYRTPNSRYRLGDMRAAVSSLIRTPRSRGMYHISCPMVWRFPIRRSCSCTYPMVASVTFSRSTCTSWGRSIVASMNDEYSQIREALTRGDGTLTSRRGRAEARCRYSTRSQTRRYAGAVAGSGTSSLWTSSTFSSRIRGAAQGSASSLAVHGQPNAAAMMLMPMLGLMFGMP